MTGVDKLELPQFSIVDIRLVSREVRFTTGKTCKNPSNFIRVKCLLHTLNDSYMFYTLTPLHGCIYYVHEWGYQLKKTFNCHFGEYDHFCVPLKDFLFSEAG